MTIGHDLQTVHAALLERASDDPVEAFVPIGVSAQAGDRHDYVSEEYVATGVDDLGLPYRTQVFIQRPSDPSKFSGTILVEPLHADGIAPIHMYSAPYIWRSGHGWACVTSQRTSLIQHLQTKAPDRYADYQIGTDCAEKLGPRPAPGGPAGEFSGYLALMSRINRASGIILAQVGAALRAPNGPYGSSAGCVLLAGHSQAGYIATDYVNSVHSIARLSNGQPVYDGFFPAGFPRDAFGPCDVPIVQVLSDGDVFDAETFLLRADNPGRHYRRDDSDRLEDRYRLYELASFPHYGTRYPPFNDAKFSGARQGGGMIAPTDTMNTLPYGAMFNMALDHLIRWASDGAHPPRAARITTTPDGRHFAKDTNGNSLGGVRSAQLEVPRASYFPVPLNAQGVQAWATVGVEEPFSAAKMADLYGTPENYRARFNSSLDALIAEGWFLAEDAPSSREEAAAQTW